MNRLTSFLDDLELLRMRSNRKEKNLRKKLGYSHEVCENEDHVGHTLDFVSRLCTHVRRLAHEVARIPPHKSESSEPLRQLRQL